MGGRPKSQNDLRSSLLYNDEGRRDICHEGFRNEILPGKAGLVSEWTTWAVSVRSGEGTEQLSGVSVARKLQAKRSARACRKTVLPAPLRAPRRQPPAVPI